MHRIHHHLCKKSTLYHQWHQHPLHPHVHWGLLGAVVLGVALSFVILGWSEMGVANVQIARAQTSGKIAVLVNSEALRASISSSLATYQADLVSEGYSVEILTGPWSTPQAVRSLLQSRRAGLTGAVLIGNVPALKFNDEPSRQGDPYWYDYPSDMYYMDLDGTWSDGNSNGTYETWDGSLPEIWVSRLKADNLGLLGDEVSILRSYFNKNHQFRTGSLSVPRRALVVYHNIDIVRSQAEHNGWGTSPSLLYGDVTIDGPSIENLSEDPNSDVVRHARQRWIDGLRDQNGYELMALNTATFATKHTFGTPPNESGGNNVTSADIDALSPKRAIWFHFLTSNPGYYLAENYIGGIYLFDSPTALVAYAGTQHSGVAGYKPLYEALAQNKTFGATLKDSAAYELSNLGRTYTEYVAWTPDHRDTWDLSKKIAATVLLGDGTLRLKTTPSSPPPCSTATLDFSGTSVGTTKSCTVDLNLSGATSATLTYTVEDTDALEEATYRVNTSPPSPTGVTGDSQASAFTHSIPVSSLTSGANIVSFTFASNLGGTTSGFRITNIRLTAGTGTPGITVGRWEMGELALTAGNSYANPFRDVSVSATFISPSGKNLAIPGFYDGNNTWKIRYTLDEVGAWQWQTVSQDSSLMKSGVVTVVNSSKKGFIRAHKADPHHFQYSNGESFFYMGDTSYNLVTLDRGSQRLPYLQRRSSQGFSHLRFIIGNDTAQGWPWGGTPASPDRARLNLSYFQKVDQTMEDLATNGMGAEIIMLNYYDASAFAWTRSQEDFFLSYLLARYGAFTNLVQWTLVNEHELYPDGNYGTITSEDIAWIRDRAAFIRARDPFKHFLTTHPDTSDAQIGTLFGSDSNLTIIQHQTNGSDKQRVNNCYYRWEGEGLEDFVAADRIYNKPVVVGEFGYEYNGSTCQGVNSDTDTLRKSAWRFRMGGAYFSAGFRSTVYNFSSITFDVDNNGGKAQWQMQYLADIFKSLPYTEMSPSFQLANSPNLALAKSNEAYLVYSPQGGTVSLNLSSASGSFAVTWHNPRTGASQGLSTVSGGATRMFNAPDNQDWALVVQKGSGSQQPQACSVATLDFSGTAVGTTRSCTTSLNLSGASSATLTYTAEDIDEAGEATWRVNASQSQNVPATGDAQVRQFSIQVPLSSLTSGTNTVSFTFASNLGGTTSGSRITNVSLTVSTTAPDTTPPTVVSLSASGTPRPTISWSVSDSGGSGLAFVQVWRANRGSYTSCSLVPGGDFQQMPQGNPQNLNPGAGGNGSWQEPSNLSSGTYCYGLHVNDNAGNYSTESPAQRPQVVVVAPSGVSSLPVPSDGVFEMTFSRTIAFVAPGDLDGDGTLDFVMKSESSPVWIEARRTVSDGQSAKLWEFNTGVVSGQTDPSLNNLEYPDDLPLIAWDFNNDGRWEVYYQYRNNNVWRHRIVNGQTGATLVDAPLDVPGSQANYLRKSMVAIAYRNGQARLVWALDMTKAQMFEIYNGSQFSLNALWTYNSDVVAHDMFRTADIDGDGNDEILMGCSTLEETGSVRYAIAGCTGTDQVLLGYFHPNFPSRLVVVTGDMNSTISAYWADSPPGSVQFLSGWPINMSGTPNWVHFHDGWLRQENAASGPRTMLFAVGRHADRTLRPWVYTNVANGVIESQGVGLDNGPACYGGRPFKWNPGKFDTCVGVPSELSRVDVGGGGCEEAWDGMYTPTLKISFNMSCQSESAQSSRWQNLNYRKDGAQSASGYTHRWMGAAVINGSTSCIPSQEICDGKDNDCNQQVDEGNVCGQPLTCPGPTTDNKFSFCYYDNADLTNLKVVSQAGQEIPAINFDWGTSSPDPAKISPDTFSARWQGNFALPEAGDYTFTVTTDDGFRLFLDDALILDKWFDQAPTVYTVTRALTLGEHLLKAEFYENGGGAVARLAWQKKTTTPTDTTPPTVVTLSASGPRPTISWSVSDSGGSGLSFVQVWRANRGSYSSCSLVPGGDFQQMPQGNPQNLDPGTGGTGSWQEPSNLSSGTYCYGLHVNDTAGNFSTETPAQRQQVVVETQAQSTIVTVNGGTAHQTIDGWGVFLGDFAASAVTMDLLADLRMNIMRVGAPPGADTSNNYDITAKVGAGEVDINFEYLDGMYQRISQRGLPLYLLISPWTPPARMKEALSSEPPLECGRIRADQTQEYAIWAANVAKRFQDRYPDADVTWSIQNETDYDSCSQTQPITLVPAGQVRELADATRSQLNAMGLSRIRVGAPEDYGAYHSGTSGYLPVIQNNIDTYLYHQYNLNQPEQWQEVRSWQERTRKPVWQTEYSWFGDWVTDDNPGGLDLAQQMHEALAEGNTTGYVYWGGATNGNSIPGQRLVRNDTATPNDKYYGFKRLSHNIPSGSRRVEATSNSGNILVSAYRHPNGTFTIVVINKGGAQNVSFKINGISVSSLNRYRYTKGGNRDETLSSVSITSGSFNDSVPGSSVTTYTTDVSGPPSCIPTLEICDGKDNDCNGQVDEGNVCGQTLTCDAIGTNAFAACFYNNQNLSGSPVVTRTDNQINFDWGYDSPASGVNIDNFSARWQGNFTFEAGDYTFSVTTDDGFRLFLDNTLILDQWKDQAPTIYTVTRTLTAGSHLLKAEFYENGGGAVAQLSWTKKTGPPADTTPPTVSITAPAANTTVSGAVTVSASASDNVGVTRVEFLVDGTVKSTDTSAPYSFLWDTTNGGAHPCNGAHTHTLSARAFDAANNQGASANVTVNMNNPSYCAPSDTTPPVISSFDVQPRSGPGPFTVSWTASDNPGGSGLKEIQVWRSDTACAVATAESPTWQKLSTLSGTATSHQDNPSSSGSYCYGLHAVDNTGLEQDERQAGKGPLEVVKTSTTLPPDSSLISSYLFDDGSGTSLTDSVGGHHGTLVNMENADWVAGKTGGALQFDGVNEYVTIPHSPDFELVSGKISFWFKLNSLNDQTLFSKDHIGYTDGGHLAIAYGSFCGTPPYPNALVARLQSLSQSYCIWSDQATALEQGQWYQLEFWFGAGGMRMAINGVTQQDTDPYTGGIETNHEPIILGAGNWFNPTTPLLGHAAAALDELRIERPAPADGGGGGECVLKQTLTIPSDQNAQTPTSFSLTSGLRYRLTASGTWQSYYPDYPDDVADAEYHYATSDPSWTPNTNLELLVNETDIDWGAYSPSHTYTYELTGQNQPVSFRVLDTYYPDNRGSLTVRVEECVTGGVQDATPPQVTSFTLKNPNRTTQDPAAFNWTVSDNQSLKQVELWRAPFVSGSCDDATKTNCGWGVLSGNVQAVSGTSASAPPLPSLTNDPAPGTYFYGLHAVDQAGNVGVEPQPVKVAKTSPPQCQTTAWIPQGCGQEDCSATQRYQTRTEGCGGATSQCAADPSCTSAPQKGSPDLNGDDTVGVGDLSIFVRDWGRTDKPPSDINQDGIVNVSDLGILFHFWGQRRGTCGFPEQVCTSVESCPGKCDLSGNICVKSDPACGGGAAPQCSDSRDNDGDQKIDFGTGTNNDPGCSSSQDDDETDPSSACVPFQTLSIDSTNSQGISTARPTAAGKTYRLTSSGTYNYWIPNTDTLADAEYADTTRVPGYSPGWNDTTDGGLELQVNGQDLIWGSAYNPNHTYITTIPGNGQPIAFKIHDSYYADNQGSLSVTVEECGTGDGGNLCGNGVINTDEQCDGTNLNGQTCESQGFTGGTLTCNPPGTANQCTLNTTSCTTTQQCTTSCGDWSDAANQCGTRSCTRADCSTYSDTKSCGTTYDPRQGHPYPRTAVFQWGGGVPEWYARFDLNMTRIDSASFISQVRQKNPNILWLPARDFNKADEFIPHFPEQWFLRDSKGNKIELYGPDSYWVDLSDLGVVVNSQRLIDYFPQVLADLVNNAGADGISSDGLYYRLHLQYRMFPDIDLDRNGQNDLNESGKGKQWVIDHWANGVDQLLNNLRLRLGDKIIMINTGSPDTPGASLVNGYVGEHIGGVVSWDYDRQWFADTVSRVSPPPIFLMNSNPDGRDPMMTRPSKDYFSFMRFGLGRAMLLGNYFEFEDIEAGEHYFNKYYDEFDVNVGYPTRSLQQVRSGVWVRFFDDGAVIVNINPRDETVSDQDIRGLSGYTGPYWRFRGGQDPVMNNGQQFGSVTLNGHSFLDYSGNTTIAGDAVLLVKSPQIVISDIIIDNAGGGTSPGSSKASLTGTWTEGCDELGSGFYTLRCASWVDNSVNVAVSTASGATTAFRPSIGVAGSYEVSEWHGNVSGACSSVSLTINGQSRPALNQSVNSGQWNSLGTFSFSPGSSGVALTSPGGCTAQADAVKFSYRGQ